MTTIVAPPPQVIPGVPSKKVAVETPIGSGARPAPQPTDQKFGTDPAAVGLSKSEEEDNDPNKSSGASATAGVGSASDKVQESDINGDPKADSKAAQSAGESGGNPHSRASALPSLAALQHSLVLTPGHATALAALEKAAGAPETQSNPTPITSDTTTTSTSTTSKGATGVFAVSRRKSKFSPGGKQETFGHAKVASELTTDKRTYRAGDIVSVTRAGVPPEELFIVAGAVKHSASKGWLVSVHSQSSDLCTEQPAGRLAMVTSRNMQCEAVPEWNALINNWEAICGAEVVDDDSRPAKNKALAQIHAIHSHEASPLPPAVQWKKRSRSADPKPLRATNNAKAKQSRAAAAAAANADKEDDEEEEPEPPTKKQKAEKKQSHKKKPDYDEPISVRRSGPPEAADQFGAEDDVGQHLSALKTQNALLIQQNAQLQAALFGISTSQHQSQHTARQPMPPHSNCCAHNQNALQPMFYGAAASAAALPRADADARDGSFYLWLQKERDLNLLAQRHFSQHQ